MISPFSRPSPEYSDVVVEELPETQQYSGGYHFNFNSPMMADESLRFSHLYVPENQD
jgi:hypothetical protein